MATQSTSSSLDELESLDSSLVMLAWPCLLAGFSCCWLPLVGHSLFQWSPPQWRQGPTSGVQGLRGPLLVSLLMSAPVVVMSPGQPPAPVVMMSPGQASAPVVS